MLFHLLIDDAVGKWAVSRQRSALGRTFEHKHMKSACEDHVKNFYSAGKPADGEKLMNVAQTFSIPQQRRHTADYDVAFNWTRTNAVGQADLASAAFEDWRSVCDTDEAQDFVLDLLFPKAADILRSSREKTFSRG